MGGALAIPIIFNGGYRRLRVWTHLMEPMKSCPPCRPRVDYRRLSQRVRLKAGFLGGRDALFRAKL
jgi:hypothetical protein